jgi:hypothetical protein
LEFSDKSRFYVIEINWEAPDQESAVKGFALKIGSIK